jgi:hypothetical protein
MSIPTTSAVPKVAIKPIAPAPPVRSRPAKPEKRPEIKLSERAEESRFVGPVPLAIALIGLAVTLGFAHRIISKTDDSNFVRARESVNQYELGRPESERNYDSPVYADALADLGKVDPASISAEPARRLTEDINARAELFHRRIAARAEAEKSIVQERIDREKAFDAGRQAALLSQRKTYPECVEGKGGHAH